MISRIGHIKSFRERALSNVVMILEHPFLIIEQIVACRGTELVFTYSRYQVAQPGLQAAAPRSPIVRVPGRDLTAAWLADRFAELGAAEEMAWHSRVECRGITYHIPMIDFVNRPTRSVLCELGRALVTEVGLDGHFVFFDTGQSFHGYLPDLISEDTWLRYLGRLLLLNEHDGPPVIDTRWVGHALMRGFAALRWSHNTNRYLAPPRLVSACEPSGL